ncbi:MAG: class I SAM-dependent RNA methyltransferase [Geodermatophilaceae bacterium]|nr:class I SAM-dependent RNA methyltransferase [Geodermatophilaceae bacterium]
MGARPGRQSGTEAGPVESWLGRRFDVEVGAVAHGGHCVSRHEGRVVFVRHALPGEQVTVQVTEDRHPGYCRADAVEIHTPAAGRVPAPCPVAGPGKCGGCDWQHADHDTQRRLKAAVLAEQLIRLGGLEASELPAELRVEELPGGALRWRTRAGFAVDRRGRIGMHPHRSHRVLPIADCPITTTAVLDSRVLHRRWPGAGGIEVAADSYGRTAVRQLDRRGRLRSSGGAKKLREQAAGRTWQVSFGGFWQIHPAAADVLVDAVRLAGAARPGERVLDLYAGVGLFGGVLAEDVGPNGSVVCIESSSAAVEDAEVNLAASPWAQARVGHVDADLIRTEIVADRPDLIVLDPPRAGAGRAVCQALAESGARITYVACDPAALARDVFTFRSAGYRLAGLRAFDLYPMTHHLETVALLLPG